MAPAPLRVSAPQSPYRDCDIALLVSEDPTVPSKVICTDAASGLIVGSTSISPGRDEINADEVIRMIGQISRPARQGRISHPPRRHWKSKSPALPLKSPQDGTLAPN